jgi:hypothetical protein
LQSTFPAKQQQIAYTFTLYLSNVSFFLLFSPPFPSKYITIMSASEELTGGSGLQQYVLLCKAAKGKGCAAVVQQSLGAPNVYVFGELLEMTNVQQVCKSETFFL